MSLQRPVQFAIACFAVAIVIAGIYGTFWAKSNDAGANSAGWLQEYATGSVANFTISADLQPVPTVSFQDEAGQQRSLADWKGKVLLVNLWATWCGPCRHEMPSLDRLQAEMGGDQFEVLAISLDRGGLELPKAFYEEVGVKHLALFNDASARTGVSLGAFGMPTTVLVDAEGRLVGRLVGPAEWDHEDAKALIQALIERAMDGQ
ncbi:MAG: TlpA disulfide reductase family protein [Parvibaculum sp.]